jgi:hypothetical protein
MGGRIVRGEPLSLGSGEQNATAADEGESESVSGQYLALVQGHG